MYLRAKMNLLKKCIATSRLFGLVLVLVAAPAFAGVEIGVVTQLNGPLLLKRANGMLKALAVDSFVEQGDVLVTEKNTYAQLRFADESELTMGPDTLLKIEAYTFNVNAADNKDSVFSLGRGSVQIKTGLGGDARPDRIQLLAPNLLDPIATLTLSRAAGTQFVAHYSPATASALTLLGTLHNEERAPGIQLAWNDTGIRTDGPVFSWPQEQRQGVLLAQIAQPSASEAPPAGSQSSEVTTTKYSQAPLLPAPDVINTTKLPGSSTSLPPGLYTSVTTGLIVVSNPSGALDILPGQFGFTPVNGFTQPPVVVPANPGMKFTPPPAFSSSTGPSGSPGPIKPNAVECEVR